MRDREPNRGVFPKPLGLVGDLVSGLVSELSEDGYPQALARILAAARATAEIRSGAVCLFDYVSNEVLIVGDDEDPRTAPLRQTLAGPVDRDLPSQGQPLSREELSSYVGGAGDSLVTMPVIAGARKLGELCLVSTRGKIVLDEEQEAVLTTLAHLAALTLERRMRDRSSLRLREWLDVFSQVYEASRVPRSVAEVDLLLQEIANHALEVSRADLVVLYEYVEADGDVRLPPRVAGKLCDERVLRERGVAVAHRSSAIFRLLERQRPFYAEAALDEWRAAGLTDSNAGALSFFAREGVVSSAGIPLRIEQERVGVLFVNYRQAQSFSPEFCEHLDLFANLAALAIGNAQFFLRSERSSENLAALNRIGRELGSAVSRDIEQIGRLIDEQTGQVIPTKNFFLCIYEQEWDHFTLPYLRDDYETREALEPQLHSGLTGYVCRTGRPLFGDAETKKRIFGEGKARPVGKPAAIWIGAPLTVRDQVVGALVVQDYDDESRFNEEHLKLLEAIASQAAIAIDNYRLRDAELRLEELSALLALSQEFGSRGSDSTHLLSSILDHLCKLAICDGSLLLLVDPGSQERLRITAASRSLQQYLGRTLGRDEGLSGLVSRTGKFAIRNDYARWEGRGDLFEPPPQRVCAVPLMWEGEVIGVMTLASDNATGKFTQREIEILQRFAGPAAVAIRNGRDRSFRDALIQAGPNAIVAVDHRGKITQFNQEAATLFKTARKDVVGKSVARLYWGGRDDARAIEALLGEKGKIREEEVFGRSRHGEKIPLLLAAALLKDESGAVLGSVGILEDLRLQSLRGRTQLLVDVLREISEEEDLDRIVQQIGDAAVTLLYADAGTLFLRQGDAFEVRFTYPHGGGHAAVPQVDLRDLSGLAAVDPEGIVFFPEEAQLGALHLLADCRSSVRVPIRTDERLLGFLVVESRQAGHFSSDQKLIEVLAAQAAVSLNRVQLLNYREKTQQNLLVSANAIMVGQIATTFIHEAKNSLNGINLAVQSLHEDLERESDLKAKNDYLEQLAAIRSEVTRFDDLSRRLQRFTQQGLRPEKREGYVNPIVTRTLELLGGALRANQMKCEVRLDSSLDRPAKGKGNPMLLDEYQIQQILMNLILNAIAASTERKPLLVETRNRPECVEIRVTDHGSGIPREVRRKLFQPFFTTKKKDGVGLGLFLSRLLIEENHGGSIEILSSTPGKGSTFAIQLPKPN